jgi:hypothetical protein
VLVCVSSLAMLLFGRSSEDASRAGAASDIGYGKRREFSEQGVVGKVTQSEAEAVAKLWRGQGRGQSDGIASRSRPHQLVPLLALQEQGWHLAPTSIDLRSSPHQALSTNRHAGSSNGIRLTLFRSFNLLLGRRRCRFCVGSPALWWHLAISVIVDA